MNSSLLTRGREQNLHKRSLTDDTRKLAELTWADLEEKFQRKAERERITRIKRNKSFI